MKAISKFLVVSLIAVNLLAVPEHEIKAAKPSFNSPYMEGELIVKFKPGQGPNKDFSSKHGLKSVESLNNHKNVLESLYLVQTDASDDKLSLDRLTADPRVEYAEPNYIVSIEATPSDPNFSQLWSLNNTGQTGGKIDADIDANEAWDLATVSNVVVGVIDTGIDYTHEDLMENMWINPAEIPDNSVDDDGNGYIDDVYGWDFVNNDNNPMDDHGHGTHVAGTIAAVGDNGVGITGVAWVGEVAALKFLNSSGSGTTANAIKAFNYAHAMGFKVTNNSWSGNVFSQALYDAIATLNGDLVVTAAGNAGHDSDLYPKYPAAYDLPNIISVAATDHNDALAIFSNYGLNSIDLTAPGVGIYSTVPTGTCVACHPSGYSLGNGTSMAAPHVSGATALFWSSNPLFGSLDVKNKILNVTDPISSLTDLIVSGGRLNLFNLFEADAISPGAVNNLTAPNRTYTSITLAWTAVGDDNLVGKAAKYDVRYSTTPINATNFDSATKATGVPIPASTGSQESLMVSNLQVGTLYHFAVKVYDNVGNVSEISNILSVSTIPDTTPPTVVINFPSNNEKIPKGTSRYVSATASDNIAVTKVELYVDGVFSSSFEFFSPDYYTVWVAPMTAKKYQLRAKVYDAAGNVGFSPSVNLMVTR